MTSPQSPKPLHRRFSAGESGSGNQIPSVCELTIENRSKLLPGMCSRLRLVRLGQSERWKPRLRTVTESAKTDFKNQGDAEERELRGLMIAGLNGDGEAHRALLTRLSSRLRAYFKGRLARIQRGPVEAEDLIQETLMAIHTRRHTYDRSQLFTPWAYAIARYKFLDYLRRTKGSMRDVPMDEASDAMSQDDIRGIESTVDLQYLLKELSPKTRTAIQYVKLEGLSVREAAARIGTSESAVKVNVHRGLKALAQLIRRENDR